MTESITIRGHVLLLHPLKAIYWPGQRALLMSDLHLGKGAHFRKAGIAVPRGVADENFARLEELIFTFQPKVVLLLGDLFHSDYNHVWQTFCEFTANHPDISFELVPGNHDILPAAAYTEARLLLRPEVYVLDGLALSHHPLTESQRPPNTYNLYGHIHPGVRLEDAAGNGLKLPAFFFGPTGGILPAFGAFTGCVEVRAKRGDRVFVIAEGAVIGVS
ncbi:MAG: ligase-associated DNA damage response endonuclease PdeM [Lewinella sp.]